jgi:cytochrome oxidase assembly protein ShyY1
MNNVIGLFLSYPVTWSSGVIAFAIFSVFVFKRLKQMSSTAAKDKADENKTT